MAESTRYFAGSSGLHATLIELTKRFEAHDVAYAVIGGMALTAHGYARMTEDIDVLVTQAGLKKVHAHLVGRGYTPVFKGSKNIRDANTRVKIEFVTAGQFPGSGKPQPVSFPDPGNVESVEVDGVKFIGLAGLVELKLASGMTGGPDRAKDLIDVQQLIKTRHLPRDFSVNLHEALRAKYQALWDGLRTAPKQYMRLWQSEQLTPDAAEALRQMLADGVVLDTERRSADHHAYLVTTDPVIAEKYDMHEASEFLDLDDDTGC
jgi:hypothetical protein